MTTRYSAKPVFRVGNEKRFEPGGELGRRLRGCIEQWILPAPQSNPAILTMFRDQDRKPYRNWVPWANEFAGKFLTHAVDVYRLSRDERVYELLEWFVDELGKVQAEDGSLSPWPKAYRLTGKAPNCFATQQDEKTWPTWDAWGHYHIMLGLMKWHDVSGQTRALRITRKIADMLCERFLDSGKRLVEIGSEEMNLAPIHGLTLLYEKTGTERYLKLAREIEKDFEAPTAGDYLRSALAGKEFYQTPKPRWESLHCIQALAELHWLSGDEKYRRALEQIWWSIVKLDRHNNGGFSSGEQAQGNPYHPGAIETCCTVAWMALSVDMLRLTGDSVVADELELSLMNSGLGMMNPTGRWVSYNTPMHGTRTASPNDCTSFQSRPGQPELNCCSVNGPRALGLVADYGLMRDDGGLVLNHYGPCEMQTVWEGQTVRLTQETTYPEAGTIMLIVDPAESMAFSLKLRIPYWSEKTRVAINGKAVKTIVPGTYLELARCWKPGDKITLTLDMSLHYWRGEQECKGLASIYRGPILLSYDSGFNPGMPERPGVLDAASLRCRKRKCNTWPRPWMMWQVTDVKGRNVNLCDFASAGFSGNAYRSWLRVQHVPKGVFGRENPLRTARLK